MFFFFNDPATTEISTLPLPDALPILEFDADDPAGLDPGHALADRPLVVSHDEDRHRHDQSAIRQGVARVEDRKSTRLNSSHTVSSYAVFCLKKKNKIRQVLPRPS